MNRDITIKLETITPLFLGGAKARHIDRHMPLRPSSVRGVLRTWFRAAAAAVMWPVRNSSGAQAAMVAELREREAELFGDTSRCSAFAVTFPSHAATSQKRSPWEHLIHRYPRGEPDRDRWPGLRYLGYGLFDGPAGSEAIAAGRSLELALRLRHNAAPDARKLLAALIWLWTNLGGLGARSRRGFGGLRLLPGSRESQCITSLFGEDTRRRLWESPTDPDSLAKHLRDGVNWALSVFHDSLRESSSYDRGLPASAGGDGAPSRQHPGIRSLAGIGTFAALDCEFADAIEALDFAGRLFQDFRSTLRRNAQRLAPLPDYASVKAGLQLNKPPASAERAAFGLPLPFYFRSLNGKRTTMLPRRKGGTSDRLASPLCFRICPIGDVRTPRYVPVLYNWAEVSGAPLLDCIVYDKKTGKNVARQPDGAIIDDFIQWARQQARRRHGQGRTPRGPRRRS